MYRHTDQTIASQAESQVTVRLAEKCDAQALLRLAALDSSDVPVGPTLVAVSDGETVAAVPVRGGSAIADPFRRTAATIQLLELRAAQLRAAAREDAPAGSYAGRLRALVRAPRALSAR